MNATLTVIRRTAGRRHVARAVRWACLSTIIILAPLSLLAWGDSLLVLSSTWRWTALILAALGLGAALLSFRHYWRRPSVGEVAAALDRAAPLENSYVVSTSQELTGKTSTDTVEAAMLNQLHQEAARLAAEARPAHPWPGPLMIAAVLACLAAFAGIAFKENGLSLRRALQPWLGLTYTRVELHGPARPPARRESFAVAGKVAGRIPKEVRLSWTGGRSATVLLNPDGSFTHNLTMGLQQNSTFVAVAGVDGHSAPVEVALRRVPKVEAYDFEVTPPPYTGWPTAVETRPSFVVLRRSKVALTLRLDLPAKSVTFVPDNNEGAIPLTNPLRDGRTWQANIGNTTNLTRTFSYRIDIRDEQATYPAEADPQMLVVKKDDPPKFVSLTHNANKFTSGSLPDAFTLSYRVTDDIGLSKVVVDCKTLSKSVGRPHQTDLHTHPLEFAEPWSISLKDLTDAGVQPLDIVIVTVTAYDNNTLDGPGVTSAEPVFFEMPLPALAGNQNDSNNGGQGGSSSSPLNINPLALQKELHRQLLRASLQLKAPSNKELGARETDVAGHLQKMAQDPRLAQLGNDYVRYLRQAQNAAVGASRSLSNFDASRGRYDSALRFSATALTNLVAAAKLEAAARQNAAQPQQQPGDSQPSPPQVMYSLLTPPSSRSQPRDEEQALENGNIEQVASDLDQLRREQQQLDREVARTDQTPNDQNPQPSPDAQDQPAPGQPNDSQNQQQPSSNQSQPGETASNDSQPSTQSPGHSPTQPSGREVGQDHQGTSGLAGDQELLIPKTDDIIRALLGLNTTDTQANPGQAANALATAKAYQQEVAEALRNKNLAGAKEMGAKTEEALDAASLLTKALLDKLVRQSIEAQLQAPGYESLIRDYSRRISYDQ